MFITEQSTRYYRHRLFTTMPLTDLPKSLHLAGPSAMNLDDYKRLSKSEPSLLQRLINISSHYVCVQQVLTTMQQLISDIIDPQVYRLFVNY